MLDKILNKKVRVGVAFADVELSRTMVTKFFEGIVIAYDDNFIVFEDYSMIGIRYIQTIKVLEKTDRN